MLSMHGAVSPMLRTFSSEMMKSQAPVTRLPRHRQKEPSEAMLKNQMSVTRRRLSPPPMADR
jgi:hypothetical protein